MFRRLVQFLRSRYLCLRTLAGLLLPYLFCIVSFAQAVPTVTAPSTVRLEFGRSIQREIAGGQKHSYQVDLASNDFARFKIEQRGIDVFIRLLGPDGKLITEFDSEIRAHGTEWVDVVGLIGGAYAIEIEPRFQKAGASVYEIEWMEKRSATERDKELHSSRVWEWESRMLDRAGEYKKALALAELVLEIRERILGPDDPEVGVMLVRIGNQKYSLGDSITAELHYKRALEIYETKLGAEHPLFADALNNLAVLSRIRGELVEAEQMFLRVVAIREKALGPDHSSLAGNLSNLGITYRRRGDNFKAEAAYERALAIREKALGPEHPEVVRVLTNLATLRSYNGDYPSAMIYDLRGLAIREKSLGSDHPLVAESLNSVGDSYIVAGEYDKAKALLERSLEIRERRLGPEHLGVTYSLASLATLSTKTGDTAKAKALLMRAIQIAEKNKGYDTGDLSNFLHDLGTLFVLEGDYTQSESFFTKALAIREKISGPDGRDVGRTCGALAQMYALKGDTENALKFQLRATRINEKNIGINLSVGTEHQKLSYIKLLSDDLNRSISLSVGLARDRPEARTLAATEIIQQKGRVLDATAASLTALRSRLGPENQLLFERLNDANSGLAELLLNPPASLTADEYGIKVGEFQEKKEKLEKEIGIRSRGFYGSSPAVTLETIAAGLPANAALIEFSVYRPLIRPKKPADPVYGEPRYIAFVVRNSGVVGAADLGLARDIDSTVESFRSALRNPRRLDAARLGRSLGVKVMLPIRQFLKGANHLLISPDGELNLIPFEALVGDTGNSLVEDYSITYLTSGRDLARLMIERESKSQPFIVANPDFGRQTTLQTVAASGPRNAKQRGITITRNLSDTYFAPLIGTEREAAAIKALVPDSNLVMGPRATEKAVKNVEAPSILHLATHGFFLYEGERAAAQTEAKIANPLLRSGLALAGANLRSGGEDDGILTAMEASGLNLWGTKLVVLSACDTGVGEIRNGEGVYGLRRSFALAGTESLVMSLWPVSDYVTRELMINYYKNLKQGLGRGESLRRVQLEMLKRPGRRHPFYWASFIQSGEWANLEGKR